MTRQASSGDEHDSAPQQSRWQAHAKNVLSLQVVDSFQQGEYILSASPDCAAKLWSIDGVLMGIFGQVAELIETRYVNLQVVAFI
jgi:hypothetical protein